MSDFKLVRNVRSVVGKALDQRTALQAAAAEHGVRASALEASAAQAELAGDARRAAAASRQAAAARQKRSDLLQRIAGIDARVVDQIGRLADRVDPCDAEADVPLALFPVRLETRYTDDGASVRIRIYPDDIHVDPLDRGLSDDEQVAGRAYWRAVWTADAAAASAAWIELTTRVHADRAAWVAAALTPNNLAAVGQQVDPQFPDVGPRSRRAAVARLLPDRFVAVAIQGDARATATGRPVPPELVVGIVSDDGSGIVKGPSGLATPAGTEWIVDYDRAVADGMGITLRLARPGAAVDQLFVIGVRGSLTIDRARVALEQLLEAHRLTTGLAVVPQGTPTNNTETDRSDWQRSIGLRPPARTVAAAPADGTNAAVLAAAFGVEPGAFANIDHGDEREQVQARAANVALWGPSWGGLLDDVTTISRNGDTLTDAMREALRVFFRDNVRGRGPIPALRIGNQPYGILPAGNTDGRWRPARTEPLEPGLLSFLRRVRLQWRRALDNVPRVESGAPIDATLLEILGSSPVLQGLRVRTVLSTPFADLAASATGGPADATVLERLISELVMQDIVDLLSLQHPAASLEKESRPLALPLVDDSDPACIDALLLARPRPDVKSVLQALLALAWDGAATAVEQAAPAAALPRLVQQSVSLPAAVREQVLVLRDRVGQASAAEFHASANVVAAQVGEAGKGVLAAYAPIAPLRTSLGALATGSVSAAAGAALAPIALAAWLRAEAKRAEVSDALVELRKIGDDKAALDARRILVAETLDLASHRLDAWITGIVERRRAALRAAKPRGIMIGAYGWVENLVRGGGASRDGGYIHAPSISHAATAGLLRSAYLTHNPDASGSGAFAVDLSSARVRVAIDILDGMRQGQGLGALLGYRIERALHEARLDRLVLSLRALAPLVDGLLTTRADAVPQEAKEAVAATSVVDGTRLMEMFAEDPNKVLAALDAPPANNPYLPAGSWKPLTGVEQDVVTAAIRSAVDAADAVADLILAEGVHQLVQGNTARAAAALDAAASGAAAPIEPTVVRTPAQGVPFTHRLLIVAAGEGNAWSTTRPRAKAEPRLEQWAGARLGPAADVIVHVGADGTLTTLDAAGFAALDLIYDSGDRALREQAIRAAIPGIPAEEPLARDRDPAWAPALRSVYEIGELAASVREVLVRARPAGPDDYARASDKAQRTIDAADLAAAGVRASEARNGLSAVLAALELAMAPPGGGVPDDGAVDQALLNLAAYGVVAPGAAGEARVAMAQMALADARRRLAAADLALAGAFDAEAAAAASQAIFGDGFWMIPGVAPPATPDLLARALGGGAGTATAPNGAIRRFVRDVASVRDAVARYAETLLLGDALDRRVALRVAQLAAPGTPGADRWVGGPLDPAQPTPDRPVTDLVLDAPAGLDGDSLVAALVVDQWVDVLPQRARRGKGEDATIDERIVSGLAVNAASASARAPQAILLAISPDGARWTTDALLDTVRDTLDLAKLRAVTLERTLGAARLLPALYEQSWSLQGEPVLDVRYIAKNAALSAIVQYVKEK